jgi:hypothetical protein
VPLCLGGRWGHRFEILRQLANLFVVRPDNLKLLLADGPLSTIDRAIVLVRMHTRTYADMLLLTWACVCQSYIALRADYRSDHIHLYFDDANADAAPPAGDA